MAARLSAEGKVARDNRVVADRAHGLRGSTVASATKRDKALWVPHDLRRRRLTIWHQSGVPARELAERAGHARPSMSLDMYSHVMPPDEIDSDRLRAVIRR